MSDADQISGYDPAPGENTDAGPKRGAAQVSGSSVPELKSLLAVAVFTLVVAALYFGKDVLIPITLAVMLSFVLSPAVNFLQRRRLWRAPAVMATVLAALATLGLLGLVIGMQASSLAVNAPTYAKTIERKVSGVQEFAVGKLGSIAKQFGGGSKPGAHPLPASLAPSSAPNERRPVPVEVIGNASSPLTVAREVLAPILSPIETTVLVFIVAIFVLMQKEDLIDRFIRVFGSSDLHRTTRALDDAGRRLSKYFLSQLAVNTCFGVVITLGLWAIGIPSSAMWGLLAGLLRFVPYIGSLLAVVAPAVLGAAVDPGWTMMIEVVIFFFVVELFVGYVVEPLLYGHSTGLSPISVIVAAIFWTWVWGPIGLIMSTPLTLCLVVLGRHVKSLEFFDVLLGDRPALTPVETFYQRILADNPDDALAQAELILSDRTLVAYYDEVVVPSLSLALVDQARGTIDRARARTMTLAMLAVIDDLKYHVDEESEAQPATARLAGVRVAVVAGRGSFDIVVATMLAQHLERHGAVVRTIKNAQVTRQAIAGLDLSEIEIVAICLLEAPEQAAELRYTIRRLRNHSSGAAIIAGPWADAEDGSRGGDVRRTIGADQYFATVVGALDAVATSRASITEVT